MKFKTNYFHKILLTILCLACIFAIKTTTFAAPHTHSDACFPQGTTGATLHVHSDACYKDLSKHDCGGTITWEEIGRTSAKCPKCSEPINVIYYKGTSSGCGQQFSATYYERCSNCNYKYTQINASEKIAYPNTACKYTTNETGKGELICGKENNAYYDANGNKVELKCSKVVVSILPLNSNQHTDTPDFTIQATYLDGHTANIQPTKTNYDSSKSYKNTLITLEYSGEVTKVGNQGTLTTQVYVTSAAESYNPYQTVTETRTDTVAELPSATITPYPNQTLTPFPTQSGNRSGGYTPYSTSRLGNTNLTQEDIYNRLGISGNRNNGSSYYGNGFNGYTNPSINKNTNDSVKDNDTPSIGTTEDNTEGIQLEDVDDYIKRTPVEIVFKTEKDVTPANVFGTLKFSENIRNEINDTTGTAKQNSNTTTTSNTTKPTTTTKQTTQAKKQTSIMPIIVVIVILLIVMLVAGFLLIKQKRSKKDDVDAQPMNLSNRLNL